MTGEMNFTHRVYREASQQIEHLRVRIETKILRIDVEIIHIEQHAATTALHQVGEEFALAHLGVAKAHI